ncbi:hypothetical protein HY486_01720 [Candidatus Woesearchaeota archaeon]|nr:hypothetical protein [Candidatus Woesearchaeota archaeon]
MRWFGSFREVVFNLELKLPEQSEPKTAEKDIAFINDFFSRHLGLRVTHYYHANPSDSGIDGVCCNADVRTFRKYFGRISPGITLLFFGLLPLDCYATWYQTGDFTVPEELGEMVKGVHLSRPATGSFSPLHVWKPFGAKRYLRDNYR